MAGKRQRRSIIPRQRARLMGSVAGLAALGLLSSLAPMTPLFAAPPPMASARPQTGLAVIPLAITTASGKKLSFRIEVAKTEAEQAYGMMFRTEVPDGTGMLFPMNPPREASFWMENTLVPLDILFIGADGRIRNIAANAVPKSRAVLPSLGPVAAVLELQGGAADKAGIRPGDLVRW